MKIENLTPQQVGTVENFLYELQKSNPQLSWVQYPMGGPVPNMFDPTQPRVDTKDPMPHPIHHVVHPEVSKGIEERLLLIEEKVDRILNAMQLVFGDHVLFNGRFVNLNNPPKG